MQHAAEEAQLIDAQKERAALEAERAAKERQRIVSESVELSNLRTLLQVPLMHHKPHILPHKSQSLLSWRALMEERFKHHGKGIFQTEQRRRAIRQVLLFWFTFQSGCVSHAGSPR